MNCRIMILFLSGILIGSCKLHYLVNNSKTKQRLNITTTFSDTNYLYKILSDKGRANLTAQERINGSTKISIELQPGRKISIGRFLPYYFGANNASTNIQLMLIEKEGMNQRDTLLYQQGPAILKMNAKKKWKLLWIIYYYGYW